MEVDPQNIVRWANHIEQWYVNHPETMEALLAKIGADHVKHVHGKYIACSCPIHMGHKPDGFRLWYDRGKAIWKCFSDNCGAGGLTHLLMRRYQADFNQAVVSLGRFAGISVDGQVINVDPQMLQDEEDARWKRRFGIQDPADNKPNIFPDGMVEHSVARLYQPEWSAALDYLIGPQSTESAWGEKKKGFSVETVRKWEVGVVPARKWTWPSGEQDVAGQPKLTGYFENRITIPIRLPDGSLIGFSGRRFDGNKTRKYKILSGTDKRFTLYGLHRPETLEAIRKTKHVVLVEGFGDVWRAHEHGQFNVLAVMGTELTSQQLTILNHLGVLEVTLYYDGDPAGQNSSQTMAEQIVSWAKVNIAVSPMGVDPGDVEDPERFCRPILQAIQYAPKEM